VATICLSSFLVLISPVPPQILFVVVVALEVSS